MMLRKVIPVILLTAVGLISFIVAGNGSAVNNEDRASAINGVVNDNIGIPLENVRIGINGTSAGGMG